MSNKDHTLVAFVLDDYDIAHDLLGRLEKIDKNDDYVKIVDAAIVKHTDHDKIKVKQAKKDVGGMKGGFGGGAIGVMVGAIVAGPVGAAIGGVSGGALAGIYTRFRDSGIDDKFMKETAEKIEKGKSALFVQYEGDWETSKGAVADAIKADNAEIIYGTVPAQHVAVVQETVEDAADELGGEEAVTDYEVDKAPEHKPDDLTQLDGIGAKTATVLTASELETYEKLAGASEPQLRDIMHGANMVAPHSLPTWPMQASFAAKGDWQGLFAYNQKQAKSKPKKVVAEVEAPENSDDLTKVLGIGPRMAEILNAGGIHTYADMQKATPDQLTIIISSGGALAPSSLATWPAQASYAAKADWEGLADYNKKHN